MHENKPADPRLPLSKWCLVLLGVPTFYMPAAYLAMSVYVVGGMLLGRPGTFPPEWWMPFLESSLYVTAVMWPVYVVWVVFSKRLTLREKGCWLFIVSFLNMVGMPWFYIFIMRRYLGIEARTGARDEAALDSFLASCGVGRGELTAGQVGVLRSDCRKRRLRKWGAVPIAVAAPLMIYLAAVALPKQIVSIFSGVTTPTHAIIFDTAKNTRKEISPDPETQRQCVQVVMLLGAMAGAIGMHDRIESGVSD